MGSRKQRKIFSKFEFPDEPWDTYDSVIHKFDEYFVPKVNIIHEYSLFKQWVQRAEENIEAYVWALYELAECTHFHDKDEAIRDRLVLGVMDKEISEKLQLTPDLTSKKAIGMARQSEQEKSPGSLQVQIVTHQCHQWQFSSVYPG